MNARILNRDFRHPADGWYQIEPMGEHANRRAELVQVIDPQACMHIVAAFNRLADAPDFPGMLIDHEHFKHDLDKESRAYGWLMKLQNRTDGIYGQIKWTGTGRTAVDSGDYRYFSTEYDPQDLAVLNKTGAGLTRVRPVRLDGLTLTNSPNNKGGKPITNRGQDEFRRGAGAPSAGRQVTNNQRTQMKLVAAKLGLSADASEEAVLAEVTKIMNRSTELEGQVAPLKNRVTELETANKTLADDQVIVVLDGAGVTDEKVRNRLAPVLAGLKNREERVQFLADLNLKPAAAAASSGTVLNRDQAKTPGAKAEANPAAEVSRLVQDYKVKNRCSFDDAWAAVKREKPELFKA